VVVGSGVKVMSSSGVKTRDVGSINHSGVVVVEEGWSCCIADRSPALIAAHASSCEGRGEKVSQTIFILFRGCVGSSL